MRYEGVYREVERNSEPKQQERDVMSRLRTEGFFFPLKYTGKINDSRRHHKVWVKAEVLSRSNSYRNSREQNKISDIEMKSRKYIFHHCLLLPFHRKLLFKRVVIHPIS